MLIYRNDTDEEVKITLQSENREELPTEISIPAGTDYEITGEQEAEFLKYMLNARKSETSEETTETTTENVEVSEDKAETTDEKASEQKDEGEAVEEKTTATVDDTTLAEERAEIAKERKALAEERAEMTFTKLCEAGKVVPAQKEAYMALATKTTSEVAVAEGETKTVSELLNSFIESAPSVSLMEETGESGDGDKEDDVELTDEDKSVAETFGNTEEEIKNIKKGL